MLLRRTAPIALALAALACEPGVPSAANPATVDYAAFDPNGVPSAGIPPLIPLPNDLALQASAIASQNPAQADFLRSFIARGGFPNDQEVPITIQFVRLNIDPNTGASTRVAPDLDLSSINQNTLRLLGITAAGSGVVAYDAPKAADYVKVTEPGGGQHGELTLHKTPNAAKSRRYDPGSYIFAVRGGASGVKVQGGTTLNPQAAMYLLTQDVDLTKPDSLTLIPGNSLEEKKTTAATLEGLRKNYLLAFSALDSSGFPHREIATMGTFKIAPNVPHVETDASSGTLPLPSDFLFANGHLLPELSTSTGPFGALGPGLATLDGFSTTAMVLAPTSGPIVASSVNKDTVFLLELDLSTPTAPKAKRLLDIAEALGTGHPEKIAFVAEPSPITATPTHAACSSPTAPDCVSTVIGLQPAIPAQVGSNFFAVPPLKEGTTYIVLVTNGVKAFTGSTPAPLGRSTLSTLLLGAQNLSSGGKSLISGVSDAQATGIDQMRGAIQLAVGTVAAEKNDSTFASKVVMAYTFKTQTMTKVATDLAALPYSPSIPAATGGPVATPTVYCDAGCASNLAALYTRYGYDTAIAGVPTHIGEIIEAKIATFNKLDDAAGYADRANAHGAFTGPTVAPTAEIIPALIATPTASGACTPVPSGPGTWTTTCPAPLAIFRHGLGGSRGQMLALAESLTKQGFVVASIDAIKQGDRTYCNANAKVPGTTTPFNECFPGSTCVADTALAGEGDSTAPGKCYVGGNTATPGDFLRKPILCSGAGCAASPAGGTPYASAEYLVSANLFRTRDSFRQDIIDQSQLVRVLAPNPAANNAQGFLTAASGYVIDVTKISYIGQSLGAINGTVDVAANPRFSRAVLNVGGGTITDTFSQSPNLGPSLNALLAGLGIAPGTAAYLQFLQVAKWVLDPADPINFGNHLTANTLPSPLTGNAAQPAKAVLSQTAACDQTVPTGFQFNLAGNIGLTPLPPVAAATATHEFFLRPGLAPTADQLKSPGCTTDAGVVNHGFLLDWITYGQGATSITQIAQDDAANFFLGTLPPSMRVAP